MHLSRLGSELVIWSSSEFGFVELDEAFSSGSSIMPQKKNPDAAELLRAKSPRVAAAHQTLLGVMHALPLTYGKDMQEDKEPLWDAIDTVEATLEAAAGILEEIAFDRERLEEESVPDREHEQVFLAVDVAVQRRLGQARLPRHVAHSGRTVPVGREHPHRGGDHLGEPLVGASLACHGGECMCK